MCIVGTVCTDDFIFTGEDVTTDAEWSVLPGMRELPRITMLFAHAGVAQPVTLTHWSFASAGMDCGHNRTGPVTLDSLIYVWSGYTVFGCEDIGREVEAKFTTEEFGELTGSFTWLGEDVDIEIDTGTLLVTPIPSPSPTSDQTPPASSPSPIVTPAALPVAGGQTDAGTGGASPGLVVAGLLVLFLASLVSARRRHC
jgi:hypothetical protein